MHAYHRQHHADYVSTRAHAQRASAALKRLQDVDARGATAKVPASSRARRLVMRAGRE